MIFLPLIPQSCCGKLLEKLYQANLTAVEWRLWSYLAVTDPWGDRYKDLPHTLTVMEKVGIKKSTFDAAIADFLPNAQDAIAYLKECLKTWDGRRTYNWTGGVLVKALNEGQKPNFPTHTQGGLLEIPDCPKELEESFQTADQKRFNIFWSGTRHSSMVIDKTDPTEHLFWQDAIIQWQEE